MSSKIAFILVLLSNTILSMESSDEQNTTQNNSQKVDVIDFYELLENHTQTCLKFHKKINFKVSFSDIIESNFFYFLGYKIRSLKNDDCAKTDINNDIKKILENVLTSCKIAKNQKWINIKELIKSAYIIAMFLNDLGYSVPECLWQDIVPLREEIALLKTLEVKIVADFCSKKIEELNICLFTKEDIETIIKQDFGKIYDQVIDEILTDKFEYYNLNEEIVDKIISQIKKKTTLNDNDEQYLRKVLLEENFFLDFKDDLNKYRHMRASSWYFAKIKNIETIKNLFDHNSENIKKFEELLGSLAKKTGVFFEKPKFVPNESEKNILVRSVSIEENISEEEEQEEELGLKERSETI